MKKYLVRQEPFGFTFFDRKKLKHQFIKKNQLAKYLGKYGISRSEIGWLNFKRQDFRKDIIYSPIRIYYELTLMCNLYCHYCFNNSGKPRKKELTTKEVLESLDHLKENNVIELRFTGGEPTCHRDWFEIFNYAKKLGFCISCNTNAVFKDPIICQKFAQLELEQVTVSIDGNKKHHEFNRGKGSFDRAVRNLRLMRELGVTLRINTLVNKYSMNDAKFMLDLASQYADEINFFTIVFVGRGSHLELSDGVTLKDHFKMSQEIKQLKPKYPQLNVLHFAEVSKRTSVSEKIAKKFGLKIGHPSGSTTFNIASDGSYCCGGYAPYIDPSAVLGHIKTDDLFDVWQRNPRLEKIRDDGGKLILFCNKCKKYINEECQGSKYEIELNRLIHPEVKNPTCIYGNGPSLLSLNCEK